MIMNKQDLDGFLGAVVVLVGGATLLWLGATVFILIIRWMRFLLDLLF